MNRLRIRDLQLGYGPRTVLRGLDADLEGGRWIHVHGSNGAGKTTLLQVLAAFRRPRSGRLDWNGKSVWEDPDRHRRRLRYIGHGTSLQESLTVRDNWDLLGGLFGFGDPPPGDFLAGVPPSRRVDRLSRGQKHRVEMASLLVTRRPLLLLDEPFVSLDTDSAGRLADRLRERRSRGDLVVSASPDPLDAADANRILRDGRLEEGPS